MKNNAPQMSPGDGVKGPKNELWGIDGPRGRSQGAKKNELWETMEMSPGDGVKGPKNEL